MPNLVVTLTPNVSTYVIGDAPISVNISSGNPGTGAEYLWESNSGNFDNKFLATTNFIPKNATKVVEIIGRRVKHAYDAGVSNVVSYGVYGLTKNAGNTTSWDAYAVMLPSLLGGIGFFQAEVTEINTEKALGFTANSSYRDPMTVNSDANLTFTLNWHLSANGTAVAKKAGVTLSSPVIYRVGDIFRVTVEPTRVIYSINNVVYAITSLPVGLGGLYPIISLKTLGASFVSSSYFYDSQNQASKNVSVTGLFPVQPNYAFELTSKNNTLVSLAEDGSATFRKKGNLKRALGLQFIERPYSEWVLINDFWKAHELHEKFIFQDLVFNENYIMRFESELRTSVIGPDNVTIQTTLKEI